MILSLETSTKVCSVALSQNGKILALKESLDEKYSHAENLTVYIQEAMSQAKVRLKDIDAVAISKGPGSFTGLRIGVSTAKGLCYALGKPLIAVHTLQALAGGQLSSFPTFQLSTLLCPMLDARRMEVYCAVYDEKLNEIKKTAAEVIDENSFSEFLKKNKVIFLGDGAAKCRAMITHPNAIFLCDVNPSARFMVPLAEKSFAGKKFEDVAYFEPFYLKDFVSGGAR